MNKVVTLCFSLIILSSCQTKKKYDNTNELCKTLGEITASDQKYRGLPQMKDPFFRIMDSIRAANNMSRENYANLTNEEQLKWGEIGREITNRIPVNEKLKDSLMALQIELDNSNTELLIDIIREKGWVTKNGLGCEEYVSAWIIFRHSQSEYWDDIRKIIEKEKAEKRIGDGDYMMIDNHIKGRPMFDNLNITGDSNKTIEL